MSADRGSRSTFRWSPATATAVSYHKSEVDQVIEATLAALRGRHSGADESGPGFTLWAILPTAQQASISTGDTRPLVATALSSPTVDASGTLSQSSVLGGYVPGRTDQVVSHMLFTLTPEPRQPGTSGLYGQLDVSFDLPLEPTSPVIYQFALKGTHAIPLGPGTVVGIPEGGWDIFKCIVRQGANVLLPALAAGFTGLSGGPAGFLAAAGTAAAAQLPLAVTGAIGCFTAPLPIGEPDPSEQFRVLPYPVSEVRSVLDSGSTEEQLLDDRLTPLDDDRWNDLACTTDDGLYHLYGLLATDSSGIASAHGKLTGEAAVVPTDWNFSIEVAEPNINVSITSLDEPTFTHVFLYSSTTGQPLEETGDGTMAAFDYLCLVTAAGGPLLTLVSRCLPILRQKGVTPFLQAMLDGAGETFGLAVTGVIRQCVGGKRAPSTLPAAP